MNHKILELSDKVAILGELEHIRAHAIRAVASSEKPEDVEHYTLIAQSAKSLRREYMQKYFAEVDEKDWCQVKAAARLRQLVYEVYSGNDGELRDLEDLIDSILSYATGQDTSACMACREDKNPGELWDKVAKTLEGLKEEDLRLTEL